ncbi:hypothetical protein L916_14823, partial [Phytophthora nicotianae]
GHVPFSWSNGNFAAGSNFVRFRINSARNIPRSASEPRGVVFLSISALRCSLTEQSLVKLKAQAPSNRQKRLANCRRDPNSSGFLLTIWTKRPTQMPISVSAPK